LCQTIEDFTVFEEAISNRLAIETCYEFALRLPTSALPEIDQVVKDVIADSFDSKYSCTKLVSFDGAQLKAYAAGTNRKKAVVIVPACGMPAKLCEHWMKFLGKEFFVVTWENRGLFGETQDFDVMAYDVVAQMEDLFSVMDHFGIEIAHLMGFCGGAVLALIATSTRPARVSSMSLWHGAYRLNPDCPKTMHQLNFETLMSMAATGRPQATSIHKLINQSILSNVHSNVAHLVLYPFATAELLFRYGKINGCIIDTDISHVLRKIVQPTLVVTSENDSTAHPAGSERVAKGLCKAFLHVEPHNDHLSLFYPKTDIFRLAARFISDEWYSGQASS